MRKITLALAGASVALAGLMSAPAAAADFRGHDRGRMEQAQNRGQFQNRLASNGRFMANNRFEGRKWNRGDRCAQSHVGRIAAPFLHAFLG